MQDSCRNFPIERPIMITSSACLKNFPKTLPASARTESSVASPSHTPYPWYSTAKIWVLYYNLNSPRSSAFPWKYIILNVENFLFASKDKELSLLFYLTLQKARFLY